MAALAARKFSLFPQAPSRTLLSRTLFQSQSTFDSLESLNFHHSVLQSHHLVETPFSEAQQGESEPRLRRSYVGGYHTHSDELLLSTFGPTEPRDVIQARTRSDQYSQYRTLRGAETGQAAPVISGPNKCCAVF
jgi:hypothetical protein